MTNKEEDMAMQSEEYQYKMADYMEFTRSNRIVIFIFLILLLLVLGFFFLKEVIHQNQKKKELSRAAEDKLRDENLNHVILNSDIGNEQLKEVYKPYDVDYSNPNADKKVSGRNMKKGENQIMVQLIERTELSTRKFMMNPVKGIRIGSDLQSNDIAVLAENISPCQCEIFSVMDKVYIKNLSSDNRTIIRRKKEQAIADEKGIRLLSGDIVILGLVSYDITIIN